MKHHPMGGPLLSGLAATAVLLSLACADRVGSPDNRSANNASLTRAVLHVARALAPGFNSPEARTAVLQAMRGSLYAEHKLILHDFVRTPEGEIFLAAAVPDRRARTALLESIDGLPPMDFYVPFKQQRLSWRGEPTVAVAATMDVNDSRLTAYAPSGTEMVVDARLGAPEMILLVIHPSEVRVARSSTASTRRGHTIQDADEVPMAPMIMTEARGALAAVSSGEGPPPAPPADTTRLGWFMIYFDDMEGIGSSEVEFRSHFFVGGVMCCGRTIRYEGVDTWELVDGRQRAVNFNVAREPGQYIETKLWETDLGADQMYGYVKITLPGDYGFRYDDDQSRLSTADARFQTSDPANRARVTTVTVSPSAQTRAPGESAFYTATAYDQNGNIMNWKTFTWTSSNTDVASVSSYDYRTGRAYARGYGSTAIYAHVDGVSAWGRIDVPIYVPSFGVTISEPANVRAKTTCTWFANAVGGTQPYSYEWKVNGVVVGGPSQDLTWTSGTTPFTMEVTVTDATGDITGGSRTVNIDPYAATCDL